MTASGPPPRSAAKTFRPRSSAQRRFTAVGRVLPSSSETSSKRACEPRRIAHRAQPQHQAVGGRDADRRRAAHGQAADGVRHLLGRLAVDPDLLDGEAGLVEEPEPGALPAHRRERLGGGGGEGFAHGADLTPPCTAPAPMGADRMTQSPADLSSAGFILLQQHFESRVLPVKGDPRNLGFSTRAVHAGQKPDPAHGVGGGAHLSDVHLRAGAAGRGGGVSNTPASRTPPARRSRSRSRRSRAGTPATPSPPGMSAIACLMTVLKSGRPRGGVAQRLRRHLPLLHPHPGALRPRLLLGRHHGPRGGRGGDPAGDEDGLHRDADQPGDGHHRHRRGRRDRPRPRRRGWRWTTPSSRPTSSGRWRSGRTSSCTRRPSS